jgi:putative ABC transport system ATP-binding protein
MTQLRLEGVSYHYKNGDRTVLNNVTCSFAGGKLNAVIGPSGSGKTTLLAIMAGLDRPSKGRVFIDGEDLAGLDLNQYRRERVSMIFQAFQLFPLLTALENVSFPMELNCFSKKEAVENAKKFLSSIGIDDEKFKRYPANLSGGEQQRVAIARSLATGARVLLADEPTGNLDKANGQKVVEILAKLTHEQHYCVIIVTHDLAIAEHSDKVWHMSDGVLTQLKKNSFEVGA